MECQRINLLTRKLRQAKIMSSIRLHPFLRVQMILVDVLNTPLKKNIVNEFLYCIIAALNQFDSFSQRVGLIDIKGHYYFLVLYFLWKI